MPAAGDAVIVPNGSTVALNVDSNALASLQVDAGGTITLLAGANFDIYLGGDLVNNGTLNLQSSTGTNTIYLTGNNVTSTFSGSGTWLLDISILMAKTRKPERARSKFLCALREQHVQRARQLNGDPDAQPARQPDHGGQFRDLPNLVLADSGIKSTSGGTMSILGDLTISSGSAYNGGGNPGGTS